MIGKENNWRPSATKQILELRAQVLAKIRQFMSERSVLEVETPILQRAGNTDPNIQGLMTEVQFPLKGKPEYRYLHTSPEFAMKRLLASGSGSIYQITRVFRDAEAGKLHQPEFTMLEWYRTGFDHHDLMNEINELLNGLQLGAAEHLTYAETFESYTGLNPLNCDHAVLQKLALDEGLNSGPDDLSTTLDFIFSRLITPNLGKDKPVFIYDYPPCQAALARIRQGETDVAERFELFIDGIEIANGYNELKEFHEVYSRFEQENHRRKIRGLPVITIDRELLCALKHGLPDCAGVALGLDRLLMVITGSKAINDVIAFAEENR